MGGWSFPRTRVAVPALFTLCRASGQQCASPQVSRPSPAGALNGGRQRQQHRFWPGRSLKTVEMFGVILAPLLRLPPQATLFGRSSDWSPAWWRWGDMTMTYLRFTNNVGDDEEGKDKEEEADDGGGGGREGAGSTKQQNGDVGGGSRSGGFGGQASVVPGAGRIGLTPF